MHSDFADIGEKPLICLADRQERNCHTTFSCEPRSNSPDQKCLLKTELEVIRNEAQGFFISEPEPEFLAKQQFKPSVNQYRSTEHITVLTSTTYQTRSLQVTLLSLRDGISHLEVCFTLRCLQRLSHPYAATRLCPWQNNRCTGGTSNPVLSY